MEQIVRPIKRSSVHRGSATRSTLQSQLHLRPAPPLHDQTPLRTSHDHVNFLLTLLCVLTNHSSILDDAYGSIMDTFFLHIHIRHAESLGQLNACQAAVNKAVQLWTDTVSRLTGSFGSFPRVSSYNQSVDNLRLCSQALRCEINLTEKQYLTKRKKKAESANKTKTAWKERVQEQVSQAIHQNL